MVLGAASIQALLAERALRIDPLDPARFGAASYTLRLSRTFRRWQPSATVDLADPEWDVRGALRGAEEMDSLTIRPGEFVLGASVEALSLPGDVIGYLSTPSHMARFGLSFVQSSTVVHPGFGGATPTQITFEITSVNPAPLVVPAGLPVCHLLLSKVLGGDGTTAGRRSTYEGSPAPSPPALPSHWFDL